MLSVYELNLSNDEASKNSVQTLINDGTTTAGTFNYVPHDSAIPNSGLKKEMLAPIATSLKPTNGKKVVFVYPANSNTAALKPSERKNQGSGGLAALFEIDNIDNAGIPTITGPGSSKHCSKEEIEHYIAELYALFAAGHQLVIPKIGNRFAFGGGVSTTFVNSAEDKFLQKELNTLTKFIKDNQATNAADLKAAAETLEAEYKQAFLRGQAHKDESLDNIFVPYVTTKPNPAASSGTHYHDPAILDKIRTMSIIYGFKISDTPNDSGEFEIKEKRLQRTMRIAADRIIAGQEENDVDFYKTMIATAAVATAVGKSVYIYTPEKEKAKIEAAATALRASGFKTNIVIVATKDEFEKKLAAIKNTSQQSDVSSLTVNSLKRTQNDDATLRNENSNPRPQR